MLVLCSRIFHGMLGVKGLPPISIIVSPGAFTLCSMGSQPPGFCQPLGVDCLQGKFSVTKIENFPCWWPTYVGWLFVRYGVGGPLWDIKIAYKKWGDHNAPPQYSMKYVPTVTVNKKCVTVWFHYTKSFDVAVHNKTFVS
jgi:hypothetical protein